MCICVYVNVCIYTNINKVRRVFRLYTCTIERVAAVTGSEKSPPGGLTAPTMVTVPSLLGEPKHLTRPTYRRVCVEYIV